VDPDLAETGQAYAYAGDDPVNNTDPTGELYEIGKVQNPFSTPTTFTCEAPPPPPNTKYFASSISVQCDSGPLIQGSLRPGSTAAEARAEAEANGFEIPSNYIAEPADPGPGWVFRAPGSTGDANTIRIMESGADPRYPNGYVRYYNQYGQPLDVNGNPAGQPETHIPLKQGSGESEGENGGEEVPPEEFPIDIGFFLWPNCGYTSVSA